MAIRLINWADTLLHTLNQTANKKKQWQRAHWALNEICLFFNFLEINKNVMKQSRDCCRVYCRALNSTFRSNWTHPIALRRLRRACVVHGTKYKYRQQIERQNIPRLVASTENPWWLPYRTKFGNERMQSDELAGSGMEYQRMEDKEKSRW